MEYLRNMLDVRRTDRIRYDTKRDQLEIATIYKPKVERELRWKNERK